MSFLKKTAVAAVILAISTGGLAVAHENENPAVKARQMVMSLYAHHLGTLGAMAKGSVDYDAEAATRAATNLVTLTQLNQMAMWPQGTDSGAIKGTRAKVEMWSSFPDVGAKSKALDDAAMAMQAAAGSSLEDLRGAMRPLGGACGACHKAYRVPES